MLRAALRFVLRHGHRVILAVVAFHDHVLTVRANVPLTGADPLSTRRHSRGRHWVLKAARRHVSLLFQILHTPFLFKSAVKKAELHFFPLLLPFLPSIQICLLTADLSRRHHAAKAAPYSTAHRSIDRRRTPLIKCPLRPKTLFSIGPARLM